VVVADLHHGCGKLHRADAPSRGPSIDFDDDTASFLA